MDNNNNVPKYKIIEVLSKDSYCSTYNIIKNENNNYYTIKEIFLKDFYNGDTEEIEKNFKIISTIIFNTFKMDYNYLR